MGSLWTLALLFFCCWEAGAPESSAGPSTHGPSPLVTMNHTEVPTVTLGVNTSLEGASKTTDLAETSVPSHIPLETQTLGTQSFDRTLIPASTISEAETRITKTLFPATETRALTKITLSKVTVAITTSVETSATSDSPSGTGMTTVKAVTGSDISEAIFDTLCTDDSSEEAKMITTNTLTLARMSAEARALALGSSSVPASITSQALASDVTVPPKALVAYTVTDNEVINYSIIEIETTAIIPGTPDVDHSLTGRKTLSTPETSALPNFTGAKPHLTRTTTSSEILSTASTSESVTPDTTVETSYAASSFTGETTAAKATTPRGTLVTVSMNPLEETSSPSVEATVHTEVLGTAIISTEAGSTLGKAASSAGTSAMVYSLSEVATIKKSTRSETPTTDSTTSGPVPVSGTSLPSAHLTTANSSQGTDVTVAKTTASAKAASTASTSPSPTCTTAQTRWATDVTTGGDEGFFLLRLSVASPEDLTDPRVAERLVDKLRHELHVHMPPIQVSLLRVRRD
ncbi:mucin-20 [Molossus molossus]|uniref:Mucin 20, cell surface associated n=1 Tax=Molossus molossus TaxID=27622 RepID=A0A7J8I0K0_MOLMO|nr:mucin-20 [Molossus molossus]KAF6478144.1 mucin 20, cell surface associated [Molossus molossus]